MIDDELPDELELPEGAEDLRPLDDEPEIPEEALVVMPPGEKEGTEGVKP